MADLLRGMARHPTAKLKDKSWLADRVDLFGRQVYVDRKRQVFFLTDTPGVAYAEYIRDSAGLHNAVVLLETDGAYHLISLVDRRVVTDLVANAQRVKLELHKASARKGPFEGVDEIELVVQVGAASVHDELAKIDLSGLIRREVDDSSYDKISPAYYTVDVATLKKREESRKATTFVVVLVLLLLGMFGASSYIISDEPEKLLPTIRKDPYAGLKNALTRDFPSPHERFIQVEELMRASRSNTGWRLAKIRLFNSEDKTTTIAGEFVERDAEPATRSLFVNWAINNGYSLDIQEDNPTAFRAGNPVPVMSEAILVDGEKDIAYLQDAFHLLLPNARLTLPRTDTAPRVSNGKYSEREVLLTLKKMHATDFEYLGIILSGHPLVLAHGELIVDKSGETASGTVKLTLLSKA